MGTAGQRQCFVISSFTPEATELLQEVIKPAIEPLDYLVRRGDDIAAPGSVMDQINAVLGEADLVVADLTNLNPNVLYEIGIRHRVGKPLILLAGKDTEVPFDLQHLRRILIDRSQPSWVGKAIQDVARAAQAAVSDVLTAEPEKVVPAAPRRFLIELAPGIDATVDTLSPPALETLLVLVERLARGTLTGMPVNGGPERMVTIGVPAVSAYYIVRGDRILLNRVSEAMPPGTSGR